MSKEHPATEQEFEQAIAALPLHLVPEMSKKLEKEYLVNSGRFVRDLFNPDVLIPVEPGTQPRRFAKVLTVNGQKKTFEGESELEVERQANQYLSQVFTEANQHTDEPTRDSNGRFAKTASDDAAAQQRFVDAADLQLQFQRGEINVEEYLERSGVLGEAVEKALDERGVSEIVQERQGQKLQQSWESATAAFIQANPDWIGGEANKQLIGELLAENGLVDAEDKLQAMQNCYDYARQNNLLVRNPEVDQYRAIENAKTREEMDNALGRAQRMNQMWDTR
ncbi:MAG: hypothetical protein WCB00_24280 [Candidatus Acidiferrales bacterium]